MTILLGEDEKTLVKNAFPAFDKNAFGWTILNFKIYVLCMALSAMQCPALNSYPVNKQIDFSSSDAL